jgi:phage gp37-like protein
MARKLAISNTVTPEVKVVVRDGGSVKSFKFKLVCTRKSSDELTADLKREDLSVSAFLKDVTTGWEGQQLVLEDDGSASPFSPEAFDDLMQIAGVPALCLQAYLKEVQAKEKN